VPDCNSAYLVGDKLFVTCAQLDGSFQPRGPGKVVVIDTITDTVEDTFDLTHGNPQGLLRRTRAGGPLSGDVLIATTEDYGTVPGCVERIITSGTPGSRGCLVTNATLGGYVSAIAEGPNDNIWLAVNTSITKAHVLSVVPAGAVDTLLTSVDGQATDFAICPTMSNVVVGDRLGNGVRVYELDGTELTTDAIDLGLAPAYANGIVCF
jgi:hypothetical protein